MLLRLPPLRHGCAHDTSLSLEYREAGGDFWREYELDVSDDQASSEAARVTLKPALSRSSVEFRLRANRGPITSEPSTILGPIETCDAGPVHPAETVLVALLIAPCTVTRFSV